MNQLSKNFIPLGDSGCICYLQDTLKGYDSSDTNFIQLQLKGLRAKKIQKLVLLRTQQIEVNYDAISALLSSNGFQLSLYTPNSEFKKQIELFETILDSNKDGNICILYNEISPSLFELTIKLALYLNPDTSFEDIYNYLTNENPDIVTINEFKNYINFLENDPYLITKPDRVDFKKNIPITIKLNKPEPIPTENKLKVEEGITLNLSSLKSSIPDNEHLLTETEAIQFNLNSLVETDFEKEESPEEHYQKIKDTAVHKEVDDSLSLDVDLSEEIEYISSLESLTGPTIEKISVVNIDTIPLDTSDSIKIPTPTIDYKNKEFLDFDAIIEEELEQGMLTDELGGTIKSEDVLSVDLSFPPPLEEAEDLLIEEKKVVLDDPVDPSQTFMVKRINEVIKKEVLNEDSKGKIPVSNLTKVDTQNAEGLPKNNTTPTTPKISNPKFNPITLDD